MSVVSVFSGSFCREEGLIETLLAETGYRRLTDEMLAARASDLSSLSADLLRRSFTAKPSVFNPFTRERERCLAWLKLALAESLQETGLLLHGFCAHLVPASLSHVLRIGLIADMAYRVEAACAQLGIGPEAAAGRIRELDRDQAAWVRIFHPGADPWDPAFYDMVLPVHKTEARQSAALVKRSLAAEALQASDASLRAAREFLSAARVQAALAAEGHLIEVTVQAGAAVLTIDRPVLMQERLEEELKAAVRAATDIAEVEVRIRPASKEGAAYSRVTPDRMSKVLLVDDEREFVQTLSERLGMRDIGAAAAFDGESALELVREDEPEVMLLDLRMPGIDGIEVLKRVKAEHPQIEVVILTGHGTDVDRKQCLQLGAFAYLEKPVDIDVLSDTLKRANEKMRANVRAKKA
ncbi:MAG: response regulator [Desulfobacterales bacterium]|jgi:CheY-like chemotaxis protein|nr:response regulator [Desulfobacterales bacterium]